MRIKNVPYTRKHITTLDLIAGDEILYRDENYFSQVKDNSAPNPTVLGSYPKLLQQTLSEPSPAMGAPLEEHKETGPLVACKVCSCLTVYVLLVLSSVKMFSLADL